MPSDARSASPTRKVQAQYGVLAPIWGHVYETTLVTVGPGASGAACASGATFAIGAMANPRIEPEIVVALPLGPAGRRRAPPTILACVDWIAHGFEIVQSPYPDWKFQAADAIAASSMHGALLIGEPQPVEKLGPDVLEALAKFTLLLSCDGQLRDSGTGANVLGHPADGNRASDRRARRTGRFR